MATFSNRTLLALLAERGPLDVASLAATLETHPLTVAQQCADLQSAGYVRQIGDDVYVLSDAGEDYLARLADTVHQN